MSRLIPVMLLVLIACSDRSAAQVGPSTNVPAAQFDAAYAAANRGRTVILVPEAYELVNIAIALTDTAIADPWLVPKQTAYYSAVREWFEPWRGHRVVTRLDDALRRSMRSYFTLKMNGYAFEFDDRGRLVRSRIYDRTGFPGETTNTLLPYHDDLRDFAEQTRFREFYRRHAALYEQQVAFYRDTADIAGMTRWLETQFPSASEYDSYRIVFSPLVGGNQSVTWLESNGFRELQPHVNFPYAENLSRNFPDGLSPEAAVLQRGLIVFTEINHGYINPTAAPYTRRISAALSNRARWVEPEMSASYPGASTFTEYMNWALISLRYVDMAPASEQERLIADVERIMARRGFPLFSELNQWLVKSYRERPEGSTVAEMYPRIIEWFEERNAR